MNRLLIAAVAVTGLGLAGMATPAQAHDQWGINVQVGNGYGGFGNGYRGGYGYAGSGYGYRGYTPGFNSYGYRTYSGYRPPVVIDHGDHGHVVPAPRRGGAIVDHGNHYHVVPRYNLGPSYRYGW